MAAGSEQGRGGGSAIGQLGNWATRKSERLQGGRCSQRCEGAEALTAGRRRSRGGGSGDSGIGRKNSGQLAAGSQRSASGRLGDRETGRKDSEQFAVGGRQNAAKAKRLRQLGNSANGQLARTRYCRGAWGLGGWFDWRSGDCAIRREVNSSSGLTYLDSHRLRACRR